MQASVLTMPLGRVHEARRQERRERSTRQSHSENKPERTQGLRAPGWGGSQAGEGRRAECGGVGLGRSEGHTTRTTEIVGTDWGASFRQSPDDPSRVAVGSAGLQGRQAGRARG